MNKSPRNIELSKIHLAKKQLGMDDDMYRDMLWTVARVRSASDLDEYGRKTVIEHLKRCGARFTKSRNKRSTPAKSKAQLIGKIKAMLAEAQRPDEYGDGMAKRMFGVDRYEWLEFDQLRRIVAALVYDARRSNRRTE